MMSEDDMEIRKWSSIEPDIKIAGQVVTFIEQEYPDIYKSSIRAIYSSVTELICNVGQHAYPPNFKPSSSLACEIVLGQSATGYLKIFVTDYGVTVPQSVLNKSSRTGEGRCEGDILDPDLIEAATLRDQSGRGQGLASIFEYVDKKLFESVEITSRNGKVFSSLNGRISEEQKKSIRGTIIELVISPNGELQKASTSIEISIADDFTKMPAGRYVTDGADSGEEFADKILIPALKTHKTVNLVLDGTYGFASSFLEEAFGGIVRKGFSASELEGRLNLISDEDSHLPHQIWRYVRAGEK